MHGTRHHGVHTRHGHSRHTKRHCSEGHASWGHRSWQELLLFLELGRTVAAHTETETRFFTEKEFVIVGPHFRTTGDTDKTPSVKLSCE